MTQQIPRAAGFFATALACIATWLLLTHYEILGDDAQLYALQALARLHPGLFANDVFLAFGSQDRFTFFTPLYAAVVQLIGLAHAAAALTLLCHLGGIAASWYFARAFMDRHFALLAIALLIAVPATYGSGDAFQYREALLTARLPAEVAVLAALACWVHGRIIAAAVFTVIGLSFHPLMAAPGAALLFLLSLSRFETRRRAIVIGAVTAGAIGIVTLFFTGALRSMPGDWLALIRDRSAYLFPTTWSLADWNANALPVASALFSALILRGSRVSHLMICLVIVALGGLIAALLVGDLIPLTLIVQIQSWRWIWLLKWIAILLIPITLQAAWSHGTAGRCAAVTFALAWLALPPTSAIIAGLAIALWVMRSSIPTRAEIATAAAAGISVGVTLAMPAFTVLTTRSTRMADPWIVERLQDLSEAPGLVIVAIVLAWWLTVKRPSIAGIAIIAVAAASMIVKFAPRQWETWTHGTYTPPERAAFAEWRQIIRPGSNVLWVDNPDAVWFLLDRASYVSQSQSAGIVFSIDTAREIRRRASMLEDFVSTRWLLALGAGLKPEEQPIHPLTAKALAHACSDPALQFVVTRDDVGPAAAITDPHGIFPGLRLYACGM